MLQHTNQPVQPTVLVFNSFIVIYKTFIISY